MLTLAQDGLTDEQTVGPVLFLGFATLTCLSAWAIVMSDNIVRMAIYLMLTLAGVAGMYFMMEAEILAALQLIVYAGGTLILIVFGVMLTSRNPFLQLKPKGWEKSIGMMLGVLMRGLMIWALANTDLDAGQHEAAEGYSEVSTIGRGLLSKYIVPFEVAGVLLLVVMIGAAYMARKRRVDEE